MLTTAQVKEHLRIEHDDEDALIDNITLAAYQFAETYTSISILDIEQVDKLDDFQSEITLNHPNTQSITSITYSDTDDAQQTQTDYYLDTREYNDTLTPLNNESWPDTNQAYENVVITYQTGFATIPEQINQAVLLIITDLYENRGGIILGVSLNKTNAAEYLLNPYKIMLV